MEATAFFVVGTAITFALMLGICLNRYVPETIPEDKCAVLMRDGKFVGVLLAGNHVLTSNEKLKYFDWSGVGHGHLYPRGEFCVVTPTQQRLWLRINPSTVLPDTNLPAFAFATDHLPQLIIDRAGSSKSRARLRQVLSPLGVDLQSAH
jgi:hypothetical protein